MSSREGIYLLFLFIESPLRIDVGALGSVKLAPGVYVYVGSGGRSIGARIVRHLRREKKPHWHIDYLTRLAVSRCALPMPGSGLAECESARRVLAGARGMIEGFGASDCSCVSHLAYLGEPSTRRTHNVGT